MFSTATSPATSLRRVHDDVGRARAATSQPSTGLRPTAAHPLPAFSHLPSSMGVRGVVAPRRRSPTWIFGAGIARFGDILNNMRSRSARSDPVRSLTTYAPVPGSPTALELGFIHVTLHTVALPVTLIVLDAVLGPPNVGALVPALTTWLREERPRHWCPVRRIPLGNLLFCSVYFRSASACTGSQPVLSSREIRDGPTQCQTSRPFGSQAGRLVAHRQPQRRGHRCPQR